MNAVVSACFVATVLFFWALLAALHPVSATVSPVVLMRDGAFRLTCRITRDPRNRVLDYGVVNYREHSQRPLAGMDAAVTHQVLIERVPCGVGPAYCAVLRNDGSRELAWAAFQIVDCE